MDPVKALRAFPFSGRARSAFRRLPIGLDVSPHRVAAVALSEGGGTVRIEGAYSVTPETDAHDALVAAVRTVVRKLNTDERRCIIRLSVPDAYATRMTLAPGMNRFATLRAAGLEARRFDDEFPIRDRSVSLGPGTGDAWILGVARKSAIRRATAIASRAGLRVAAVDHEACAWRRAVADVDAVLDVGPRELRLTLFGEPVGESVVLSTETAEDDLVEQLRARFNVARLEDVADVRRLAVVGDVVANAAFLARVADACGVAVIPATLPDEPMPGPVPWLLAYGLALWSIEGKVGVPAPDQAAEEEAAVAEPFF